MKIVTAIDSFKGSMTSKEANEVIKKTLPQHQVETFTVADGGEGTVEAFIEILKGRYVEEKIIGPEGAKIDGKYGWIETERLAIIEVAEGAGITKITSSSLHPRNHTSYGVGEQIISALNLGAEEIIIGLGGSATVDGGMGLLQALGVKFYDSNNKLIPILPIELGKIHRINKEKMDARLRNIKITVASDVDNELFGKKGAVYVFGPQKGILAHDLDNYDKEMEHYAKVVNEATKTKQHYTPGAGAAGGIGFALYSFLNASFQSGFQLLAEKGNLENKIKNADLIITGEGKFDSQSLQGKVPIGISRLAKKYQTPVIIFAGIIEKGLVDLPEENIKAAIPIVEEPMSLDEAMKKSQILLESAVTRAFKLIDLGKTLS